MNEKFNKNAKVEQLTNMFLSRGKKKALSLKILLWNVSFGVQYIILKNSNTENIHDLVCHESASTTKLGFMCPRDLWSTPTV